MIPLLVVLYVIVSVLLILIVLLQTNKAAGMGLFGGSETVLGSSGADVLTKITAVLAVLFVIIAFSISYIMAHKPTITDEAIREDKRMREANAPPPAETPPASPVMVPGTETN